MTGNDTISGLIAVRKSLGDTRMIRKGPLESTRNTAALVTDEYYVDDKEKRVVRSSSKVIFYSILNLFLKIFMELGRVQKLVSHPIFIFAVLRSLHYGISRLAT